MTAPPLIARFDALDWRSTPAGAREKRLESGGLVLRLVEFPEGFEEREPCRRAHAAYVMSGSAEIETVEGARIVSTGTAIVLPPGSPHRLRPRAGGCVLLLAERD